MNSLLIALSLLVSGPWSLADCINHALEHNITVKQKEITVAQREVDLNTAESRRLPTVSGSAGENFSFGRGITTDNTYAKGNISSTSFSAGARMPIFQGFDINKGIEMGKLNLAAAMTDLEKARDDIRVAVAKAYVQILYDQELLQVAENQVAVDEMLCKRIEAMKESGMASTAEVAAQQSTYAQSKLSATQAENALKLSILDLTQLLELQSPEGFSIVIPSDDALGQRLLPSPESVYADAVREKAVIQAEDIRLDYAKVNIEKAKSAYYPTLSLSGGLDTRYYKSSNQPAEAFGTQLKNNMSPYVGLSLNIPIFQGFQTRNAVRNAKLNFQNQELQLESVKKSLYKEIQQVYYNAVAAQAQLESSREAAASAEKSLTLTREKYENGKANVTEYNESRNRYLKAESDYLQARYKSVFQAKLLDFYKGAVLTF